MKCLRIAAFLCLGTLLCLGGLDKAHIYTAPRLLSVSLMFAMCLLILPTFVDDIRKGEIWGGIGGTVERRIYPVSFWAMAVFWIVSTTGAIWVTGREIAAFLLVE